MQLLYGQSGVGKSSLLEAGLLPRLALMHDVRVSRRDETPSLPEALAAALAAPAVRPRVVVLDQCEEAFAHPGEWARLAPMLPSAPARVLLSFRKEWLPEVEAALAGVSFGKLFVERIDREGDASLRSTAAAAVDSGLALDVLAFLTTPLGTARGCTREELVAAYAHVAWEPLVTALRRLALLADARLAHDTLATVVRRDFDSSDRPGQRARRILESRAVDWKDGQSARWRHLSRSGAPPSRRTARSS